MANIQTTKSLVANSKSVFVSTGKEAEFIREAGFAIRALEANSFLASLDPKSITTAIENVALTGLTLNPVLKLAYLVPRGGKCTLDVSYVGMIKILTDAGAVKNVDADVVYEADEFQFQKGTNPFVKHVPAFKNKGEKIGVYAIAYFRGGGSQAIFMNVDDIEKIKKTSESLKKESTAKYSPWINWEDEMWKKTAIRRLYKILPKTELSDSLISMLSNEDQNDNLDYKNDSNSLDNIFEDVEIIEEPKIEAK